MYSKDDLLSKDISELVDIAKQLGAKCQPDDTQENIAYAILDAQAENPAPVKRKRTRITKKDTDHVYSVNGKDGENFDIKKNKVSAEPLPLFKDEMFPEAEPAKAPEPQAEVEPAPKKRGRKSKAEKEALAAAAAAAEEEARQAAEEAAKQEADTPETTVTDSAPIVEEEEVVSNEDAESQESNENMSDLLAQLQAKVNAHNEAQEEKAQALMNGIWEGDPGDGTDFIPVVDLPIEDHSAIPNYDMFDNPTTPMAQ